MGGDHRNVLCPLAQRRHLDFKGPKASIQIPSKTALFDICFEVRRGACHQPGPDAVTPGRSGDPDFPVPHHAGEPTLSRGRQLADVRQKQRAVTRLENRTVLGDRLEIAEPACSPRHATTEEFVLYLGPVDGGAVKRHKGR